MSQSHPVTVIGSRFRIEPWTTILRDGGFMITPPDEVQGIGAAVHLATVAQLPNLLHHRLGPSVTP